jgi:outer membrane protein assembly factor BamB
MVTQVIPLASRPPLRLLPGVIAVAVQWTAWFIVPLLVPGWGAYGLATGAACGLIVVVWWLLFSRAPWLERVAPVLLIPLAVVATRRLVDPSIAGGAQGYLIYVLSVPAFSLALVLWAVGTRRLARGPRRIALVATILLTCSAFLLIRTAGVGGGTMFQLHWRWTPTPEERLLAQVRDEPPPPPSTTLASTPGPADAGAPLAGPTAAPSRPDRTAPRPPIEPASGTAAAPAVTPVPDAATPAAPSHMRAEWPGFRGPNRDGVVPGVHLNPDWSASPPVEVWRRPIGPGWSSFAVRGDLLYTQEQRGEEEIVGCYRVSTGEPVWRHRDRVRFYESNGGPGPRGTPTIHDDRVYSVGATGIVNALDASNGVVIWTRNAATDTGREVPMWGIASSPLVIDDVVIVAVSGQLAAYDARTGAPRWMGQKGGGGYSSPHLAVIAGVPQVLLMRGARTISVSPADGQLLWEHNSGQPVASIVQPALAGGGEVLIAAGDAMGGLWVRRVGVSRTEGGWSVNERWNSRGLKPYFNDFVVHEGYVYGFDNSILASINLEDGQRKWKGGRYGNGQLLLLPDQDLLLVISEEGELALVNATPDQFTEVARFKVLDAKTWNHPVVVGDILLVRNGEEMAAFRLPGG